MIRRHAVAWLIVGGAVLRFSTLAAHGFWFDEWLAIGVISRDPSEMLPRIAAAETNPPLYFLIAAAWERVAGSGEVALRSLSALAGTLTIPVVYAAARRLADERVALLAAALTAFSPFLVWYSVEARPYALVLLFASVSFLCAVELIRGGGPRWLWGWVTVSALAIATHYLAALLVGLEAVWLLLASPLPRSRLLLAGGVVAAVVVPLVPLATAQSSLTAWIPLVDQAQRLWQVPQHFLIGMEQPWPVVGPLAVGVVTGACALALGRARGRIPAGALACAAIVSGGLAIMLIAAVAGSDFINTRNLIVLWVPFAIAVAAVLAAYRLSTLVAAGLCAAGVGLVVWSAVTVNAGRPDWDAVAAAVSPVGPERALITDSTYLAPLGLYLDGAREPVPGEQATVSELDVVTLRDQDDYSVGPCWWLAVCGGEQLIDSAELPFAIPAGFRLQRREQLGMVELERYVAVRPVALPAAGSVHQQFVGGG
jgi:uncharacterized membrane protein